MITAALVVVGLGRAKTALISATSLLIVNALVTAVVCSHRARALEAPTRWLWVRALASVVMFAVAGAYLLFR